MFNRLKNMYNSTSDLTNECKSANTTNHNHNHNNRNNSNNSNHYNNISNSTPCITRYNNSTNTTNYKNSHTKYNNYSSTTNTNTINTNTNHNTNPRSSISGRKTYFTSPDEIQSTNDFKFIKYCEELIINKVSSLYIDFEDLIKSITCLSNNKEILLEKLKFYLNSISEDSEYQNKIVTLLCFPFFVLNHPEKKTHKRNNSNKSRQSSKSRKSNSKSISVNDDKKDFRKISYNSYLKFNLKFTILDELNIFDPRFISKIHEDPYINIVRFEIEKVNTLDVVLFFVLYTKHHVKIGNSILDTSNTDNSKKSIAHLLHNAKSDAETYYKQNKEQTIELLKKKSRVLFTLLDSQCKGYIKASDKDYHTIIKKIVFYSIYFADYLVNIFFKNNQDYLDTPEVEEAYKKVDRDTFTYKKLLFYINETKGLLKDFVNYISHNLIFNENTTDQIIDYEKFMEIMQKTQYEILFPFKIRERIISFLGYSQNSKTLLFIDEFSKLINYYDKKTNGIVDINLRKLVNIQNMEKFCMLEHFIHYEEIISESDHFLFYKNTDKYVEREIQNEIEQRAFKKQNKVKNKGLKSTNYNTTKDMTNESMVKKTANRSNLLDRSASQLSFYDQQHKFQTMNNKYSNLININNILNKSRNNTTDLNIIKNKCVNINNMNDSGMTGINMIEDNNNNLGGNSKNNIKNSYTNFNNNIMNEELMNNSQSNQNDLSVLHSSINNNNNNPNNNSNILTSNTNINNVNNISIKIIDMYSKSKISHKDISNINNTNNTSANSRIDIFNFSTIQKHNTKDNNNFSLLAEEINEESINNISLRGRDNKSNNSRNSKTLKKIGNVTATSIKKINNMIFG